MRLNGVPGATQQKKNWKYNYTIDNIPSWASSFEYDLEYHAVPLRKISIARYTYYGAWPFIKVQSVDWCEKDFDVYSFSGFGCGGTTIELQKEIDK